MTNDTPTDADTLPELTIRFDPLSMPLYAIEESLVVAAENLEDAETELGNAEYALELANTERGIELARERVDDANAAVNDAAGLLNQFLAAAPEKRDRVCNYIAHLESVERSAKLEIDRLQSRKTAAANRIASLKRHLLQLMTHLGVTKLEGVNTTISKRKNPPSVQVDSLTELPSVYKRVEIVVTPDKALIMQDLKRGLEVEGARVADTTYHVRLK